MVLLEVNPRRAGNLWNEMYMEAHGVDFESDSLLCQWDYKVNIDIAIQGSCAGSLEFPKKEGTVTEIRRFNLPNKSKQKWNYFVEVG